MRILVINHRDWLNPRAGGVEEVVYQTTTRWAKWGHEVHLLVSNFPGPHPADLTVEGVRVARRAREEVFNWVAPWYIRSEFGQVDVIVEHLSKVACLLPWRTRVPVVGYFYHLLNRSLFGNTFWPVAAYVVMMEKLALRVYRRCPLIAISQSTADELVAEGISRSQIQVIYCGLQTDVFRVGSPSQKDPYPSVLWVGRVRKIKGVSLIVEAFERIRQRLPTARLTIVGRGDFEEPLRQMIQERGLEKAVTMTGYLEVDALRDAMQRAWVLAYPSPKEGWGLCVIQAAACGTPTVASNSPGLCESVCDGKTGFLVPHGNIAELAGKISQLLTDDNLRAAMGREAVQWARNYTWENTAAQSLEVLQKAAASARPQRP